MIQNVTGSAIFETPAGSAGSRPNAGEGRPAAENAAATGQTSGAQDAAPTAERSRPVSQSAGSERTTDDSPRGQGVDIRV